MDDASAALPTNKVHRECSAHTNTRQPEGFAVHYTSRYTSPLGNILLAADASGVTGLWFERQKYFASHLDQEAEERETPLLKDTKHWLDLYFSGREPDFIPPLHLMGTSFQNEVWQILLTIPYGHTTSYGEIARQIAAKRDIARMSARAVGSAVGHNKIAIVVPCHRVVGAGGNLTGYAAGIDKKIALLQLEKVDMTRFVIPKTGSAL